ncbi:cytochrome P450 family 628 [Microdochium nivale]|nr:cytochrome P450 family 628 [Microdochium nivale]
MPAPRAFVKPLEFIPERWTTKPGLILNKNAWFPSRLESSLLRFILTSGYDDGNPGIGKQLALSELRVPVAKMLLNFDVTLAPSETGRALLEESKDMFLLVNGKLNLVFTSRAGAAPTLGVATTAEKENKTEKKTWKQTNIEIGACQAETRAEICGSVAKYENGRIEVLWRRVVRHLKQHQVVTVSDN